MERLIKKWREFSKITKALYISQLLLSWIVILISCSGLLGYVDINTANSIAIPILGIILAISSLLNFKHNRLVAVISFCSAAIILIVSILVLVL